jgi:hypothetical protein
MDFIQFSNYKYNKYIRIYNLIFIKEMENDEQRLATMFVACYEHNSFGPYNS